MTTAEHVTVGPGLVGETCVKVGGCDYPIREQGMRQYLGALTLLVADYDEAIHWYTEKLGFGLVEDIDMGKGKRWVLVAPPGSTETRLLLARATDEHQAGFVGNQSGGRVMMLLHTDDFERDWQRMTAVGVTFREKPRREPYGIVAVFEDLYGNAWDLLQPFS